jgi:hypothetical protein
VTKPSFGHATLPAQVSCGSQIPALARHSVPVATRMSPGHVDIPPLQVSATSQIPALARHSVPDAVNPSFGHASAAPVQVS